MLLLLSQFEFRVVNEISGGYREEKQKLSGHSSTVRWVKALSSSTLVSASRDTTVRIWDVKTGECTAVLEGHTATIRALAAHGDTLVSASYDGDASLEFGEEGVHPCAQGPRQKSLYSCF